MDPASANPAPARPARPGAWLLLVLYLGLCLWLGWRGLERPAHNWDLVAYMALVLERDGLDPAAIHQRVYGDIQASPRHDVLTGEKDQMDYRRKVAADPEALRQQLGFYRFKLVYNLANWSLHRLGAGLMASTVITSALAFLAAALALWFWLAGFLAGWRLMAAALLGLFFTNLYSLAGASTPDTLAAAFFVLAWWLGRRWAWAWPLGLLLAQAARPDYAAFGWALMLGRCLVDRRRPGALEAAYLLLSLGLHLALTNLLGHYSWGVFFRHSFLEFLAYPAQSDFVPGPAEYLRVMRDEMLSLGVGSRMFSLILAQLVLLSALGGRGPLPRPLALLLVLDAAFLLHFLVHPSLLLRYYLGPYLVMVGLLFQAAQELSPRAGTTAPPGEVARRPGL
ncbi:MAG: hypothetical protein ACOZHQ_01775 [Thermodesulfobacteriota bacterium]